MLSFCLLHCSNNCDQSYSYLHTTDMGTPNTPVSQMDFVFLIPSIEVAKDKDTLMEL